MYYILVISYSFQLLKLNLQGLEAHVKKPQVKLFFLYCFFFFLFRQKSTNFIISTLLVCLSGCCNSWYQWSNTCKQSIITTSLPNTNRSRSVNKHYCYPINRNSVDYLVENMGKILRVALGCLYKVSPNWIQCIFYLFSISYHLYYLGKSVTLLKLQSTLMIRMRWYFLLKN